MRRVDINGECVDARIRVWKEKDDEMERTIARLLVKSLS